MRASQDQQIIEDRTKRKVKGEMEGAVYQTKLQAEADISQARKVIMQEVGADQTAERARFSNQAKDIIDQANRRSHHSVSNAEGGIRRLQSELSN